MRTRGIALGIAIATATALAATAGGPLIATPNVGVAELDTGSSGSASVSLMNNSASTQSVAMIAQDSADCDDALMVAAPQSFAIASGSMQTVSVACNASASAGMRRCLYHVEDAGGSDLATFLGVCDASASTGAVLSPSPSTVAFSPVAVGSSATLPVPVMLTNLGSNASATGTLHLQLTDLGGNFLLGAPCNPNVNGCDLPGTQLGSAAIDVICQPSAVGTFTSALYVVDSLGDRLTAPIPLTCTGTAPGAGPSIHVSTTPSPLDLRTVSVLGGSGSGNVHIQSVGTSALTITSITILGAGNNWTSSLGTACSSLPCNLAPQSALDVAVRFTPSAIGPGDARMVIASNDPVNGQVDIQLAGVGGGAMLALAPGQTSSIDLGDVAKTGSASFPIHLVNAGDETANGVALALAGSAQFSISPPSMVDVPAGATPTPIMLTCAPSGTTGTFTTTFTASGSNVVGASMVSVSATCHETDSPLLASPTYLALGELRTETSPGPFAITLKNTSASAITLSGVPTLSPATNVLTITGPSPLTIPAMGSAQVMVNVDASTDATIATAIIASDTNGDSITIPVTGALATASFSVVPSMGVSGTFCVGQPTTPLPAIALMSTGTATIELPSVPAMALASSPFTVSPQTPLVFPADIAPGASALVDITPNRRDTPAPMVTDALVWTTDVAGSSSTTNVEATFIADGAAIAPMSVAWVGPPGSGPAAAQPPHQFLEDSLPVTIQNCLTNGAPITLMPSINPPFSIDTEPSFPTSLSSGAPATFGVSFHPTHPGTFTGTLSISTSASPVPLTVALTGIGQTTTPYLDAGSGSSTESGQTSFYACSCAAHDPRGGLPIVLAFAIALRPRRARRRA